ncbi:MAG TPA: hypothetical protein VGL51_02085 [Solirubrobacteraceae bacterium]|jgi:hypothetical protein
MRAVVLGAVLVLCLGASAAAQTRPKLPLLPTDVSTRHNLQVRPFVIGYTGDGSGFLGGFDGQGVRLHFGRMRWTQWNRTQATGHGAVWLDDCMPDCAGGTFHPYRVTVYATQVQANVFRRLTLRYRYQGKRVVDRRKVVHAGRDWYYGLVGVP